MIPEIQQLIAGKNCKNYSRILSKYPEVLSWIDNQTSKYNPSSLSEKLYILLKSPPTAKPCGKYPLFNSYKKGYRLYCGSRKQCACSQQDHRQTIQSYHKNKTDAEKQETIRRSKQTFMKNYGVENPVLSKEIKEKIEKTNLNRYNAKNPLASEKIKEKIKQTNKHRYGVEYPFQSTEILKKSHSTLESKYGKDFMKKARESFLRKNNNKNPFVVHQLKIRNRYIENFGVDHPMKDKSIQQKSSDTLKKNYGVINPAQIHIEPHVYKILDSCDRFKELVELYSLKQLSQKLGVSESVIWNRHDLYNLDVYSKKVRSQYEEEISHWLDSLNIEYTRNFKLPSNKTVDFLINKTIAIEFNGLYTHSINSAYGKRLKIDKFYHYNKFVECKEQGIRLITIFEDEWNSKKEIIKNKVKIALGLASVGSPARKTTIQLIDYSTASDFLEQYHLQGSTASSLYYGAYYNKKLIGVMTFLRRNDHIWELNRFATDVELHPGLFSKMLKFFQKSQTYNKIISFSDNRWSWGDVYSKNNFTNVEQLDPDYSVTDYRVREHKFNWRKDRIASRFNIDISEKTEWELTQELNWDRIWDCGKVRWELTV